MFSASRKGSYVAQAGQTNPLLDAFSVASAYSFNPFDLTKSGMKADTAKYISKKENEAKRDYYQTMGESSLEGMKTLEKAGDYAAGQQRMAGGLGLLGALSYGTSRYFQDQNNKPPAPEPRPNIDNSAITEKLDNLTTAYETSIEELRKKINAPLKTTSDFLDSSSGTGGVTPTVTDTNTSFTPVNNESPIGLQLMTRGIEMGMTPQAAAGMAGNAQYESANFTAHEEYVKNSWGTKGAGWLQWTDADTPRRTNFESWSANNNLDPKSREANMGFLTHELQGGEHWTGGRSTSSYSKINDIAQATREFQNHYLRPKDLKGSLGQRTSNAQSIYDQWLKLQQR